MLTWKRAGFSGDQSWLWNCCVLAHSGTGRGHRCVLGEKVGSAWKGICMESTWLWAAGILMGSARALPRVLGRYLDLSHLWLLCRLSMKQMSVCRADISLAGAADSSFTCGANYGHQLDFSVWVAAFPGCRSVLFPSFAVVSQGWVMPEVSSLFCAT